MLKHLDDWQFVEQSDRPFIYFVAQNRCVVLNTNLVFVPERLYLDVLKLLVCLVV